MRTYRNSRCRAVAVAAVVWLAGALSGCTPTSVTLRFGGDPSKLEESTVLDEAVPGAGWSGAKVAQIDVSGLLIDAEQSVLFGDGSNPVDELVARLQKAERDPAVKAVIVRINSPGGSVAASETMYAEVRRFREVSGKPVVAAMGEIAASGGYYLSLAADRTIAQRATITGSIGVIIPTFNLSRGMERVGIESRAVVSGANKDLASPFEPMRDGQYAVLQHMVDQFYAGFRGLVLDRRTPAGFPAARADELLDGRVFTGSEAAALRLVDATGGVREAFDEAKRLANLNQARLVKYHADGARPKTPYASTAVTAAGVPPTPAGPWQFNLVQLNLGGVLGGGLPAPAAYYLWTPGVP